MDMALREPVTVTKNDRDHVVIISAEAYEALRQSSRRVRRTGTLTDAERALIAAAEVPPDTEQRQYLIELARSVALSSPTHFTG